MQLSSVNDVKIYNLSHGKSLPEVRKSVCFWFYLARKPQNMFIIANRACLRELVCVFSDKHTLSRSHVTTRNDTNHK